MSSLTKKEIAKMLRQQKRVPFTMGSGPPKTSGLRAPTFPYAAPSGNKLQNMASIIQTRRASKTMENIFGEIERYNPQSPAGSMFAGPGVALQPYSILKEEEIPNRQSVVTFLENDLMRHFVNRSDDGSDDEEMKRLVQSLRTYMSQYRKEDGSPALVSEKLPLFEAFLSDDPESIEQGYAALLEQMGGGKKKKKAGKKSRKTKGKTKGKSKKRATKKH